LCRRSICRPAAGVPLLASTLASILFIPIWSSSFVNREVVHVFMRPTNCSLLDIKSIEKVKLAEQAIKSLADDCTASSYVGVLSGSLPVFYLPPSAAATPFQALDHAAGILLIQEADLAVTDLQSKPIVFREGRLIRISKSILAAPASLQSRLVEAINKVNNPPPLPLNVTVRKHFVDPRVVRKAIADALGCAVSDVDVSLL